MTTPDQPGWYDDPQDPNAQRYWGGQDWTPQRQRKPMSRPTPERAMPTPPPSSGSPPPLSPGLPPPPPTWLPPAPDQQSQWSPPGGYPPLPSGGPSTRSRTPIAVIAVIGVIAVIAVLAVGGVLVYKFVLTKSPEDQIRAVMKALTDDENNADTAGLATLVCHRYKDKIATSEELHRRVNAMGTAVTSVSDIHVTGDRATAMVTTKRSKVPVGFTVTDSFVKENDSWKYCGLVAKLG